MSIWKAECLRYKYFFGTIFCVEALLDLLRLLNMLPVVDGVDTVYSFWQMISWIFMISLISFDFFSFFYLGKDRLLHLLPVKKAKILYMKSVVYGLYMMLYFTAGLVRYLVLLPQNATNSVGKVAFLYILSKLFAVISFFALLSALLMIVKKVNNKVIGAIIMAVLFGGIVSLQACGLFHLVSLSHDVSWTIGIVDGAIGINQYANILPIVFTQMGNTVRYVEESFYGISLWLNTGVIILSLIISTILHKTQKFNYIES